MKFGVKLPNSGPFARVECLRAVALQAERLGYDSLWVQDHVTRSAADAEHHFAAGALEAWQPPIEPNVYEPISTLAYLAGMTSRIILGTSIIVLPLRNPVLLAKQAACVDQFSGGRLILGVGVGGVRYARSELGAVGALHLMGSRGQVTDEWIDVLRHVWQEPTCNFEGKFIQVQDAEVFPKPVQRPCPPIWIGGFGERAIQRAARRGDGWLPMYFLPSEIERGVQRLRHWAVEAGRDPYRLQVASEHWLSIDADKTRAERRAAATLKSLSTYLSASESQGTEQESVLASRLHEAERNLVGDPDTVLAQLGRYREAGVDHLILRVIAHDFAEMLDALRLFKREVMDRAVA